MHITPNSAVQFRTGRSHIKANETCPICFDLSMWLVDTESRGDKQEIAFSVSVDNFLYQLPIKIDLTDQAKRNARKSINRTVYLLCIVIVSVPIMHIFVSFLLYVWFVYETNWKAKRVERAVKHFSVNKLRNNGSQQQSDSQEVRTHWAFTDDKELIPASQASIELMEQLMH